MLDVSGWNVSRVIKPQARNMNDVSKPSDWLGRWGNARERLLLLHSKKTNTSSPIPCWATQKKSSPPELSLAKPAPCHRYQDPLFRLAAPVFRKSYQFRSSTGAGSDEAQNYRDFLPVILDSTFSTLLVPLEVLSLPFKLRIWTRVGRAMRDCRRYMIDMFNQERNLLEGGKPGTGNFMSVLARVSEGSAVIISILFLQCAIRLATS